MFEFYLAGAELSFRRESQMVFQIQMALNQQSVPLTRYYIAATEAAPRPAGVGSFANSRSR
jgi:cyclopropane-fatty-acyl-phospholipid synthase